MAFFRGIFAGLINNIVQNTTAIRIIILVAALCFQEVCLKNICNHKNSIPLNKLNQCPDGYGITEGCCYKCRVCKPGWELRHYQDNTCYMRRPQCVPCKDGYYSDLKVKTDHCKPDRDCSITYQLTIPDTYSKQTASQCGQCISDEYRPYLNNLENGCEPRPKPEQPTLETVTHLPSFPADTNDETESARKDFNGSQIINTSLQQQVQNDDEGNHGIILIVVLVLVCVIVGGVIVFGTYKFQKWLKKRGDSSHCELSPGNDVNKDIESGVNNGTPLLSSGQESIVREVRFSIQSDQSEEVPCRADPFDIPNNNHPCEPSHAIDQVMPPQLQVDGNLVSHQEASDLQDEQSEEAAPSVPGDRARNNDPREHDEQPDVEGGAVSRGIPDPQLSDVGSVEGIMSRRGRHASVPSHLHNQAAITVPSSGSEPLFSRHIDEQTDNRSGNGIQELSSHSSVNSQNPCFHLSQIPTIACQTSGGRPQNDMGISSVDSLSSDYSADVTINTITPAKTENQNEIRVASSDIDPKEAKQTGNDVDYIKVTIHEGTRPKRRGSPVSLWNSDTDESSSDDHHDAESKLSLLPQSPSDPQIEHNIDGDIDDDEHQYMSSEEQGKCSECKVIIGKVTGHFDLCRECQKRKAQRNRAKRQHSFTEQVEDGRSTGRKYSASDQEEGANYKQTEQATLNGFRDMRLSELPPEASVRLCHQLDNVTANAASSRRERFAMEMGIGRVQAGSYSSANMMWPDLLQGEKTVSDVMRVLEKMDLKWALRQFCEDIVKSSAIMKGE